MAAGPRVKGQEVTIAIQVDGSLQTSIDTIQSAEFEIELDLLQEGYLGEKYDRVDSIYKTIRVNLEGHANSKSYMELADAIAARAQRRAGGAVRIDIVGSFAFPNGDFPSILIPDVHFESIPFTVGGRDEFVSFTLSGRASSYKIIS